MIVIRSRRFIKQMKVAPLQVRRRALERVELLMENEFHPFLNNHGLSGELSSFRSINVTGDWRIIYSRAGDAIFLRSIGTHHQLYGN